MTTLTDKQVDILATMAKRSGYILTIEHNGTFAFLEHHNDNIRQIVPHVDAFALWLSGALAYKGQEFLDDPTDVRYRRLVYQISDLGRTLSERPAHASVK